MPKGVTHLWTREELEDVMACSGVKAHQELAARLDVKANTLYSTRGKVRTLGGIDAFMERQHVAGTPLKSRAVETLTDQLARVYLINSTAAGRDGIPQYTVTIPSRIAELFIDSNGRQVRFEPREEGILIVSVPPPPTPELPSWVTGNGYERGLAE